MPKVRVNADLCGMCGLCVATQPEVFEFDEEGRARAVVEEADSVEVECPFGAIEVE